ncbi:hypothetical protein DNH61_08030 [Paenibacillus sambharensis]|uniref:Uncharacterized protein n=1 Tax=Paenibacillus sambharensis TaxID=1803190 RepID=A0A2W1LB56_9BACL|nr:hypothetical protein [Paenibacillus sambharensis]PZD96446.1 hypothetical protein DNH61_08030 [Paenibacillus sambharensis]
MDPMDSMDKKLKRDLSGGPLTRNGFDERLEQRIRERLDHRSAPARRSWLLRFGGWSTGAVAMIILILAVIQLGGGQPAGNTEQVIADYDQAEGNKENAGTLSYSAESPPQTALLIALRKDTAEREGEESSTYRTLLVTAGENLPEKVAEDSGILMPYRTNFWRVDVGRVDLGKIEYQVAGAYNAQTNKKTDNPVKLYSKSGAPGEIVRERIDYVGNRYIALTREIASPGAEGEHDKQQEKQETVWVMEVSQLGQARELGSLAAGTEQHAVASASPDQPLAAFLSSREDMPMGTELIHNWTLTRKPGRWIAERALMPGTAAAEPLLQEIGQELDTTIVQHNQLDIPWHDIRAVEPAAVDAYTSPAGNLAVILTDRRLLFYGMEDQTLTSVGFEEAVGPDETIIMVQWAIVPRYVEMWKEQAGSLLRE